MHRATMIDSRTPLHQAILNGHIEAVSLLISRPAIDLERLDSSGRTVLHYAALTGNNHAIRAILATSNGPDLLTREDHVGRTPYDYVESNKHEDCSKIMLE